MDNNELKEIFFTRADVENGERTICENCFEHVVFMLRDNKDREFSIGLTTVLECLAFAISNGDLPKLPISWLNNVDHVYYTNLSEREDISYND